MKKLIITIISLLILVAIVIAILFIVKTTKSTELISIKSQKQLEKIYEGETLDKPETLINILTMPFSFFARNWRSRNIVYKMSYDRYFGEITNNSSQIADSKMDIAESTISNGINETGTTTKDYSTTNVQVENVDEADVTKTDGNYIYSLSGTDVVITDVTNPESIKIASKITSSISIPEELILFNDKLIVIKTKNTQSNSSYNNTIVEIYDIQNKEQTKMIKSYELYEPYYTSRCIDGKLYVISYGSLKMEDDKVNTYYKEDNKTLDIGLDNIKYLKEIETRNQTIISMTDLNNIEKNVKVSSYLLNIENAYISENNIYLAKTKYDGNNNDCPNISSIFGLKGVFGIEDAYYYDYNYEYYTEIYKFNILEDGTIKYSNKTRTEGKIINQFSMDEYKNNFRIAVCNDDGSRIVVFNEKLEEIGKTEFLAEGENMYSSRFMGNKAYLVTYRTVDPLYVIDLSEPTNPVVQGELKIPGYSTYLHPYDDTHIIGIGMQTEETVNRNQYTGKVISTTARITGMKMALFDVSDVNNPKQISEAIIGDSRTTSAILTNHKALLFSKEKELIAIPINNYAEDFSMESSLDDYNTVINSYKNRSTNYIAEGYLVYKINLTDGLQLKGTVTHENTQINDNYNYYYGTLSRLLRGLYIENNLYTISENKIKVNELEKLQLISELDI